MFDFGFSKLFVLAVIALVVIGPERLPRVARTLGHLYGRLQRYVTQVKSDIHREMEAADLGKMKTEFESAARSFQSSVETSMREADREVRDAPASVERALEAQPVPHTPPAPQLELGIDEPGEAPSARDRASGSA